MILSLPAILSFFNLIGCISMDAKKYTQTHTYKHTSNHRFLSFHTMPVYFVFFYLIYLIHSSSADGYIIKLKPFYRTLLITGAPMYIVPNNQYFSQSGRQPITYMNVDSSFCNHCHILSVFVNMIIIFA